MRRFCALCAVCLAVAGCGGGGGGGAETGGETSSRAVLIAQIVESVRGTVGAGGTPCVEAYLGGRSVAELDRLLTGDGVADDLDRAFTAAVIACVDR